MNPFRSVGALLAVALSAVVVGALLIGYFMVVPSLQQRLVGAKMTQLEHAVPGVRAQWAKTPFDFAANAADTTNARVVVFGLVSGSQRVVDDSAGNRNSGDVENDPIALDAVNAGRVSRGVVSRDDTRYAEVAIPVRSTNALGADVVLVSADLTPQFQTIHVVKRRLLIAGLVALAVALAVGYGGAWAFARRIRRLERAAEQISGGRFDQPIVDPSHDELGELARAFDRMRVRLAQLDDARKAFIANASHELRTPLFSLGGFLELLDDEDLDEDTRDEFLGAMREQVDRLTRLATDLLDLSRMDAGRIRVERRPLDLDQLARVVVDEFSAVAQATDHSLEVAPGERAHALGDPERVLQIGRLLVENAIVHTPPGTHVQLRVDRQDGRAVLAVEDGGPGVQAEHAEQVFERFYRAEGGRSSGSGLGLAIGRELARLMDGTIELDSQPGRTVFALSLPAAEATEELSRETSLAV